MEEKLRSKNNNTNNTLFNNNSENNIKISNNTIIYTESNISTRDIVKKSLIELEFEKKFSLTTEEILYKTRSFYQKVRLVIEPNRIISYSLESKKDLLFVLDFNQLLIEIAVNKRQKKFRILILGSSKDFRFKTHNYYLYQHVLLSLNYFISNSKLNKYSPLEVSLQKNFFKVIFLKSRTSSSMNTFYKSKLSQGTFYYFNQLISLQSFNDS